MRIGLNPNKDIHSKPSDYLHQVIIPVYIPNLEGYFTDSLKILKLCITSLFNTVHDKTFITIVNNGSCQAVKDYLESLFNTGKIQELIHTENIGKLNSIIKGLVGNDIELVTISDADVLFLPNWQQETVKIFNNVPNAGVVGIVPQFKMYENYCGNVIYDNLLSKKLKFFAVKNPEALKRFYDSIGWDRNYNKDYLKYNLGLEISSDLSVLIGAGHFVATYKKNVFSVITSFLGHKLGGDSEVYLDKAPLKKDYWRLTTLDNYAYHMGNTFEDWMEVVSKPRDFRGEVISNFNINKKTNSFSYFLKNKLFVKFFSISFFNRLILKWKGLPKQVVKKY
ncbi:glycosyltransferase family A protein [Thalassobellus sediminis]|uniref:glycosyltransferase family A protein n=1 Tax=Thalassobellus sediminis TaxID=3367753 RepID=UPI0037B1AC01